MEANNNSSESEDKIVTDNITNNNNINDNDNNSNDKQQGLLKGEVAPPWVPFQYPMMPPPPLHYLPYHHPLLLPHYQYHAGGSNSQNNTIWIGGLYHWMDEEYLRNCFASTGEVVSIKVIRNKQTGISEGYGFVEFCTYAAADKALQMYSHSVMPNTDQPFRLNRATFSMGDKRSNPTNTNDGSDLSIFVGDLAADVTDELLHQTFATRYSFVKAAKVVIDANTNLSKGYGFVRFGDNNERTQAMSEMNGVYCSSRPMRIGPATPRKSVYQQYCPSPGPGNNCLMCRNGKCLIEKFDQFWNIPFHFAL